MRAKDDDKHRPVNLRQSCVTLASIMQPANESDPCSHVLFVVNDGMFNFMERELTEADVVEGVMLVTLEEVVQRDPTLMSILDLPEGWCARRSSIGGQWERECVDE